MTQAILWDLDGTIADTAPAHFAAWQETMGNLGVTYSHARFMADFGRNNGEILPELLGSDTKPERIRALSLEKEAAFRQQLHNGAHIALLPGVADWLTRFDEAGIRQGVGSSGPMANIVAIIQALAVGDYFYGLLTGIRLPKGKPHPAIFRNLAAALEAEPEDCIVIEDSVHGIEAARRAGMASIAVGSLSQSARLDAALAQYPGPPCLRVAQLTELSWTQIETLWSNQALP